MTEHSTFVLGAPGESIMIDLERLHCWEQVMQEIENNFPFMRLDLEVEARVDETMLRVRRRRSPHADPVPPTTSQRDIWLKIDLKRHALWQDISRQVALVFPEREAFELAVCAESGEMRIATKASLRG